MAGTPINDQPVESQVQMRMAYKPIDRYGLIGDMSSAALVGTDGSIDWCCFPRFDSPSVFAALLDDEKGGYFQIAPAIAPWEPRQSYLRNTNILCTEFKTPTGEFSVTDFMPLKNGEPESARPHQIHRIVRCTSGKADIRCAFHPRPDYSRAETTIARANGALIARGGRQTVTLCSQVPMELEGTNAWSRFTLHEGEEVVFVLAYGYRRPLKVHSYRTYQKLAHTRHYWESLAESITYDGLWKDEVVRSLLLLYLMIYEPTGAIVAAPTTSLPEGMGGSRNWDYRFGWLRDSSFTMEALYRMGQVDEASRYVRWLSDQCRVTNGKTRIVYGISPSSSLKETILDHLPGYQQSGPVRAGNGAQGHFQLDVFGEVILGIYALYTNGGEVTDEAWAVVQNFAEVVCRNWRRKDRGVWEVRGRQQHFVYSKIMCWAALDRALKLASALGREGDVERWQGTVDVIREEVMEQGWSEEKQAFVQRYNSDALDASNLMIPFVDFLKPNDPRMLSNLNAISTELSDGPFVRRYDPKQTDDGFGGQEEGSFTLLSFWLIGNLVYTGQVEQAREYFEQILGCANHLGLFAEMIDPRTGRFLGNFPQAYSHIGLIHTARNLSRALTGRPARCAEEQVQAAD